MVEDNNSEDGSILMRGQIPVQNPENVRKAATEHKPIIANIALEKNEMGVSSGRKRMVHHNLKRKNWSLYG
jgi:hypothetical protein